MSMLEHLSRISGFRRNLCYWVSDAPQCRWGSSHITQFITGCILLALLTCVLASSSLSFCWFFFHSSDYSKSLLMSQTNSMLSSGCCLRIVGLVMVCRITYILTLTFYPICSSYFYPASLFYPSVSTKALQSVFLTRFLVSKQLHGFFLILMYS